MSALGRELPRTVPSWPAPDASGRALLAIAHAARIVGSGGLISATDERQLWRAGSLFNICGSWWASADAFFVLSMSKSSDAGRHLETGDHQRLRRVLERAHAALDRLDREGRG